MNVTFRLRIKSEIGMNRLLSRMPLVRAAICLTGLSMLAAGCQDMTEEYPAPRRFQVNDPTPINIANSTGIQAAAGDPMMVPTMVAANASRFKPRTNPFALQPIEQAYEVKQTNLRVFSETGAFFPAVYEVQEEPIQIEVNEPQPYRRLAGVIVGESVMAIIDMGAGRGTELIRPGQQIPNSPWRVISIDEEKAVLRRSGNRRPREIVVRLENPPFGGAGGPAGGTNAAARPGVPGDDQGGRPPARGGVGGVD